MSLVRYALPYLLLLYFLGRSTRQRIFLLGIPFLLLQRLSVFSENARLLYVSRLAVTDVDWLMIWLVIVWGVYFGYPWPARRDAGRRVRVFGPALSSPEELVLLGIAALGVLAFVLTLVRFGTVSPALGQAKGFIYLLAGYLLLRGIFCQASRRDVLDLIASLVVVNTIAAGLFFLHQGLHLPIYSGLVEHQTLAFGGQRLTRSFYFMPQLMGLSLAFCFAKPKWGVLWTVVLVANLAAIGVTYTRTLIVTSVVELVVVLGVRILKAHQVDHTVKRALSIGAILVIAGIVAFVALPSESGYFASRISGTTEAGPVTADANLQSRFRYVKRTYASIGRESRVLGQGYAAPGQEALADDIAWMSADVDWLPMLYRFGLLGIAGYVILYGLFARRALLLSRSASGDAEFLSLVVLAALVAQFLVGMTSWTTSDPYRYPLGLWLFAVLTGEVCRRRGRRIQQSEGIP